MLKLAVICSLSLAIFASGPLAYTSDNARATEDSLAADRAKYIALVKASIKGKERMRADSIFKNIKVLKMPAGRLLAIMDLAYSRSLGVSCGHCHNTTDFSSEEKGAKDITRQMIAMNAQINNELLRSVKGLEDNDPVVNCTTCHRGEVKPALDLPERDQH